MRALFLASLAVALSATACNAEEKDPSFCRDVSAQRKQCQAMRIDCHTVMNESPDEIVKKIRQCPVAASMDMMPPSGKHPEIGLIPCCTLQERSPEF